MKTNFFDATIGQVNELHRILGNIGFGKNEIELVLRSSNPETKLASLAARFANGEIIFPKADVGYDGSYDSLLPSLSEQAAVAACMLKNDGKDYEPSHDLDKNQCKKLIKALDGVENGHEQAIADCEAVIVWHGDLRKTLSFYRKIIERRQVLAGYLGLEAGNPFGDTRELELHETAWQGYGSEPGIFIAEGLNLVDNWDDDNGSSDDQARQKAKVEGHYLNSVEAIAFYAMADPKLYALQDGFKFPNYNMAGIRAGKNLNECPYSHWKNGAATIEFDIDYSDCQAIWTHYVSRPTVKSVRKVV